MEWLRLEDFYYCGVAIALSKTKHSNAGLGVFAERTFRASGVAGSYYKKNFYLDLFSRHSTQDV